MSIVGIETLDGGVRIVDPAAIYEIARHPQCPDAFIARVYCDDDVVTAINPAEFYLQLQSGQVVDGIRPPVICGLSTDEIREIRERYHAATTPAPWWKRWFR